MGRRAAWLAVCAGAVVADASAAAQPASVDACVDDHRAGQELRLQKRLLAARGHFRSCARSGCPDIVVSQCAEWLEDVEKEVPSIVVAVQDSSGADRTDVQVSIDGTRLAEGWAGAAREVDPGEHTVTVTPRRGLPSTVVFVAREGEKHRLVTVRLREARPVPRVQESTGGSPARTIGWVAAGVGLAALGTFAALAVSTKSDYDALRLSCESAGCTDAEIDPARTKALVADIFLAAGVVALGVGGYLVVSTWTAPTARPSSGVSVAGRF